MPQQSPESAHYPQDMLSQLYKISLGLSNNLASLGTNLTEKLKSKKFLPILIISGISILSLAACAPSGSSIENQISATAVASKQSGQEVGYSENSIDLSAEQLMAIRRGTVRLTTYSENYGRQGTAEIVKITETEMELMTIGHNLDFSEINETPSTVEISRPDIEDYTLIQKKIDEHDIQTIKTQGGETIVILKIPLNAERLRHFKPSDALELADQEISVNTDMPVYTFGYAASSIVDGNPVGRPQKANVIGQNNAGLQVDALDYDGASGEGVYVQGPNKKILLSAIVAQYKNIIKPAGVNLLNRVNTILVIPITK